MSKRVQDWIKQRELDKAFEDKQIITLEEHEEEINKLADKFTIISTLLIILVIAIFLFVWFSV